MAQHLDDYTCERLRLALPTWSDNVILELLGKIRATLKKYACKMTKEYELELLRKETVIRKELFYRIKQVKYDKIQNHKIQERLINGRIETPFNYKK